MATELYDALIAGDAGSSTWYSLPEGAMRPAEGSTPSRVGWTQINDATALSRGNDCTDNTVTVINPFRTVNTRQEMIAATINSPGVGLFITVNNDVVTGDPDNNGKPARIVYAWDGYNYSPFLTTIL